jgi:hypothetical protein
MLEPVATKTGTEAKRKLRHFWQDWLDLDKVTRYTIPSDCSFFCDESGGLVGLQDDRGRLFSLFHTGSCTKGEQPIRPRRGQLLELKLAPVFWSCAR